MDPATVTDKEILDALDVHAIEMVSPKFLAEVIELIKAGTINNATGRKLIERQYRENKDRFFRMLAEVAHGITTGEIVLTEDGGLPPDLVLESERA